MKFSRKKNSLCNYTYVNDKISSKSRLIINEDISCLKLPEISHLLREGLCIQICINIALEKMKNIEIDFNFYFNNNQSEIEREALRELLLLDKSHWDINPKAFIKIKKIIDDNFHALKLPEFIIEEFKRYVPKELIWDNNKNNSFEAYMNDTRMGVFHAYGMIISLKRAILNETEIYFNVNGNTKTIKSIEQFEAVIIKSIDCNEELRMFLDKENKLSY